MSEESLPFVLIPGSQHGAWCFEALLAEMERRGHRGVAVDVPVEDTSAGLATMADTVVRAALELDGDVVMVGHSLAGTFLPLASARLPTRLMVFLAAMVPIEGRSLRDQARVDPDMITYPADRVEFDAAGRSLLPPDAAIEAYYHDCDPAVAALAARRLRRQSPSVASDTFPVGGWPTGVPAAYVVCAEDRCVAPTWSRRAAWQRLGVEAYELPGGHSPFLARPAELLDVLERAVAETATPR